MEPLKEVSVLATGVTRLDVSRVKQRLPFFILVRSGLGTKKR